MKDIFAFIGVIAAIVSVFYSVALHTGKAVFVPDRALCAKYYTLIP